MTSAESVVHPPDIVAQLRLDHGSVRTLLNLFERVPVAGRAEYFCELVPVLVGHETAEEEVVYPAIRSLDPEAGPLLGGLIEEQAAATAVLARMEDLDPQSEDFASELVLLRRAVLAHAAREEVELFALLDQHAVYVDRPTLAVRYQLAKQAAPTHPHPHAPHTAPANLIMTPVASMVDRIRDALR